MPAKVSEHFEIPPDATGTVKVKCRHCASTISGRVETTSNFISHLKVAFLDSLNVCLLLLKKYGRFTCYIQASYYCQTSGFEYNYLF